MAGVPEAAIQAAENERGLPERVILEAALPALRKQWEEQLLSDDVVEAAERAFWGCISGSLEPDRFREALRAAIDATHEGEG